MLVLAKMVLAGKFFVTHDTWNTCQGFIEYLPNGQTCKTHKCHFMFLEKLGTFAKPLFEIDVTRLAKFAWLMS
jgi:hypothetical protein